MIFSLIMISLFSFASAVFSIEKVDSADFDKVSPESDSIQVVRLLDEEGDPVNQSRLEDRSDLSFYYDYNNTEQSLNHLFDGFYYADLFVENSMTEVLYELEDNSPTAGGTVNTTEEISTGRLDLDVLTDLSRTYEAGEEIQLRTTVNNLEDYFYVDVDDSSNETEADVFVIDSGGDGTYSFQEDLLLTGIAPPNAANIQTSNLWSGVDDPVAFNDSRPGNEWDDDSDTIIIDRYDGGTVSERKDRAVNTGYDEETDTKEGQELYSTTAAPNSIKVTGDVDSTLYTMYDNDSDGQYTSRADNLLGGVQPSEGRELTDAENVPEEMMLASYDVNDGNEWSGDDLIAVDHDNDSQYTVEKDDVMAGQTPPEGAQLNTEMVEAWEDGNTAAPTIGDVEVHDNQSGDAWDASTDAIWMETSDTDNGYDAGADVPLAGSPTDGMVATEAVRQFNQWENVSGYDSGGEEFDPNSDAIVMDYFEGGTYSTQSDTLVAGSFQDGFTAGTGYTTSRGIENEWGIGIIDQFDGNKWDNSQDSIVRDYDDGGTYSMVPDTVINHAGGVTSSSGVELTNLSSITGEALTWSDNDGNGRYTTGDEIFVDRDSDEHYTVRADHHLAGASLSTAGEGTVLTKSNPWSDDERPVLFRKTGSGNWSEDNDSIVFDRDSDGAFTSTSDTVVNGDGEDASPGDELLSTDRNNFTAPDVTVFITNGNYTTSEVLLGRNPSEEFVNTIEIPDFPDSEMIVQFHAETPRGGVEGSTSLLIETREQGIGFDSESDLEFQIDRAGTYSRDVNLRNFLDVENEVHVEVSEDLESFTNFSDTVYIPAGGDENVTFEFEIVPAQSVSGEITFTENETGEDDSTDVSISGPSCVASTQRFCLSTQDWLNVTADERGNFTQSFDIRSIWTEDEPVQVDLEAVGGVSDYITLSTTQVETAGTETVEIDYSVEDPGNFTGQIIATADDSLTIPIAINSNVMELDTSMSVSPETLDFGAVPAGENVAETLNLENTGTLELTDFQFSSDYSISTDDVESISAGETTETDVTIEEPQNAEGQISIEASSEENNVSETLEVSMNIVKPEEEMTQEIRDTVSDLRSRANSTEVLDSLLDIESDVTSIQTAYDQGNYAQAQSTYQTAISELESLEITVDNNQNNQNTGGGGTQQPSQPQNPSDPSGSDSSGGGLLIFFFLLVLVLGIGFVLYTSYYPEEGDPLYSLLGEENR